MTERALASHDRNRAAVQESARAALALGTGDLRALASWDVVRTAGTDPDVCGETGRFVDATLTPAAPWGGPPIDLRALTARLRADGDAAALPGVGGPVWRLFDYGPISGMTPGRPPGHPTYLVVWVADGQGVLWVRALALGPTEARASLEASLVREAGGGGPDLVRRLAVRPVR